MASKSGAITISVTDEILNVAIRDISSHCMIAEAIKAELPDAKRVSVDLATIRFTRGDKRYVYMTPAACQKSLLDFDAGEKIEPFSCRLGRPSQIAKAGRHGKGSSVGKKELKTHKTKDEVIAQVPTIAGGKTPPIGPLTNSTHRAVAVGRRRAYGLRAMATRFPAYKAEQEAKQSSPEPIDKEG
jgi:hypothetical protein